MKLQPSTSISVTTTHNANIQRNAINYRLKCGLNNMKEFSYLKEVNNFSVGKRVVLKEPAVRFSQMRIY